MEHGKTNVMTQINIRLAQDQKEAGQVARQMLKNQGGGELTTKVRDSKIRNKDMFAPGNSPNPPKDKEH